MKKFLLDLGARCSGATVPALAAALFLPYLPRGPRLCAPLYNWTVYIGGHVGGAFNGDNNFFFFFFRRCDHGQTTMRPLPGGVRWAATISSLPTGRGIEGSIQWLAATITASSYPVVSSTPTNHVARSVTARRYSGVGCYREGRLCLQTTNECLCNAGRSVAFAFNSGHREVQVGEG